MQVYFPKYVIDTEGKGGPDYQNLVPVTNGRPFTKQESSFHPVFFIKVPGGYKPSVMVMYDVTAHYLHMLAYGDLNKGRDVHELIPYKGPNPPPGTGIHKYYFILYSSTNLSAESGPEVHIDRAGHVERANFDLEQFEEDNELVPIASLFFTVEGNLNFPNPSLLCVGFFVLGFLCWVFCVGFFVRFWSWSWSWSRN